MKVYVPGAVFEITLVFPKSYQEADILDLAKSWCYAVEGALHRPEYVERAKILAGDRLRAFKIFCQGSYAPALDPDLLQFALMVSPYSTPPSHYLFDRRLLCLAMGNLLRQIAPDDQEGFSWVDAVTAAVSSPDQL
jgi:hypothetical protein